MPGDVMDWKVFSREMQLLLECAAACCGRGTEPPRAIEADVGGVNWEALLSLVERHRIVPQACSCLGRHANNVVPSPVQARLEQRFRGNARRNLHRAAQLAKICRAMNASGIPVMCVKGPVLAMEVHGGIENRQFRDLDLLVRPEDLIPAARVLGELGYRPKETRVEELTAAARSRMLRAYKHLEFIRRERHPELVELHWRLADRHQLDLSDDRLWRSESRIEWAGGRCYTLPPLERIAFLAWHGGSHRWKRLSWLFDLAAALRMVAVTDRRMVIDTARQAGATKYLALGLLMLRDLLQFDLGSGMNELTRRYERCLASTAASSCVALKAGATYYEERPLSGFFWSWRMANGWRARWHALRGIVAPQMADIHRPGLSAIVRRCSYMAGRAMSLVGKTKAAVSFRETNLNGKEDVSHTAARHAEILRRENRSKFVKSD